nr:uncharacterized protein LOC111426855 [Onthophagus taurus]
MKHIKKSKLIQIKQEFVNLNNTFLKLGVSVNDLEDECFKNPTKLLQKSSNYFWCFLPILFTFICILYQINLYNNLLNYFAGVRCIIPNNYIIWEATRPISDCNYCLNVSKPIILKNVSRNEFAPYAYTSKPVIVREAVLHWPAINIFNFTFFKNLYENTEGGYKSVDEECQFLHFKSNFICLRDVFSMSESRINNDKGEKSWYVGWGNCHNQILQEMRKYYPKPHFLPEDCEIPSKEYVFMGYDDGATMHLDFISRLMWQAQLKGSKKWILKPSPECDSICETLSFIVNPGDAVLIDTRVWYHQTIIKPGEFSLSITSEYG